MKQMKVILIADDEPEQILFLQVRLEANGYQVISAPDGEAGLQAVRREKPDLILLDIMMPIHDGIEIARILRDDPSTKEIPIIFLTGLMDNLSPALKRAQGYGYTIIGKPYDPVQLLRTIRRALNEPPSDLPNEPPEE